MLIITQTFFDDSSIGIVW